MIRLITIEVKGYKVIKIFLQRNLAKPIFILRFIYFREGEGERERERICERRSGWGRREGEERVLSRLCTEPNMELDLMILRTRT